MSEGRPRCRAVARLAAAAIAGLGLAAGAVAVSYAYWTAPGSGSATAATSSLGAPQVTDAQPGAGTVALGWSAVAPPGIGAVAYYVTRDDGPPGGDCPTASSPGSSLGCTDSGLVRGSYTYTVTAVWHSWSATSSPAVEVAVASGAMSRLSLAAASATPAAGAADGLTVTALDAYGNAVTAYSGSHSLTFAGAGAIGAYAPTVSSASGAAVAFGGPTPLTFSAGVASASGASNGVMRLYRAETASVTVSEGGSYGSAALTVTVAGASVDAFAIPTPGPQVAGTPFAVSITARDAYGNTASYAGPQCLAFSGPATSPNGTAPTYPARGSCASGQSAVTFSAGVAASVSVTLAGASASTVLAAADAPTGKSGSTGAFAVASGAMSRLSLAAASATPAAGAADGLTVTALDAYGNAVTAYSGSHSLTFAGAGAIGAYAPTVSSASGAAVAFGGPTPLTFSAGVASASGASNGVMRLYRAETASVTVSEGGSYGSAALTVTVVLPAGLALKAQYRNYDASAPSDNQIKPGFEVVNSGTSSVALSVVTVRYWFTGDGGATTYQVWCDYATLGCASLTEQTSAVSPVRTKADEVLELGFASAAGSLAPGASTDDAQLRFNKTDWSVFNETDDYSYATNTSYADSVKVTVYYYGNLVWGTEP